MSLKTGIPAAVVFDMDGLLLDTEPLYQTAWSRAATALGYTLRDEVNRSLIGLSEPASLQVLHKQFGNGFSARAFRSLCAQYWKASVDKHGVRIKPGAIQLLNFLDSETIPFAIATSSHRHNALLSLRGAGLAHRFHIVVTGDQVRVGKPAPDIYLEAARRLAVDSTACVAFEDSEPGLMAATRAGMRTILVPDINRPSKAAMAKALHVLPSLDPACGIIQSLGKCRHA